MFCGCAKAELGTVEGMSHSPSSNSNACTCYGHLKKSRNREVTKEQILMSTVATEAQVLQIKLCSSKHFLI